MGIESNKEAYQMVKNTLGSIENRFREAYNKGYKDGLRDGASQVTAKLVSKILEETETDTPQTERIKTTDYCDICNHNGCDNCIANSLDDYCVPSGYAPKDTPQTEKTCDNCGTPRDKCVYCIEEDRMWTPQTDCKTCKHYKLACELFSEVCKYEPTTQNSNLTFEKDTPQTDCETCKYGEDKHRYAHICNECGVGINNYTPQTDCIIADAKLKAHCLNCVESGSYKCTKCDGEMYYKTDTPYTDIYPLTIVKDRYTGVYSNGKYTAWNMYFEDVPREIDEDDVSCRNFWHSYDGIVGLGETIDEAVEDLRQKLRNVIDE